MKHRLFFLMAMLLIVVCAFAKTYKVTASKLNVRNAPDKTGAVVGSVTQDMEVEVISISDGWAEIKYKGKTAYISAQYITPVKKSSASNNNSSSNSSSASSKQTQTTANASSGSKDSKSKNTKSNDDSWKSTKSMMRGFHMTTDILFTARNAWYRRSQGDPWYPAEKDGWELGWLGIQEEGSNERGRNNYGFSLGFGFEYNAPVYHSNKTNILVGFRTGIHYDWFGTKAMSVITESELSEDYAEYLGFLPGDYWRCRLSNHVLSFPLQPQLSFEWQTNGGKSIGLGIFTGPIFEAYLGRNEVQLVLQSGQFNFTIDNYVTGKCWALVGNNTSTTIEEPMRSDAFNCQWSTGFFFQISRFRLVMSTEWAIYNYAWQKGGKLKDGTEVDYLPTRINRFITAGIQIVMF